METTEPQNTEPQNDGTTKPRNYGITVSLKHWTHGTTELQNHCNQETMKS